MKTDLQHKLSQALLKGNPVSPLSSEQKTPVFVSEIPMILTLDQLRPNPDNPRRRRNPRYEDIKSSIRARGLASVPIVTKEPDSSVYIFSDGGNTRYQILSELWQETQDERFFRLHVLFKPWPGRLECLIGHLAENEVRGELTFLEKARGICEARTLYEEVLGKKLSLRAFAQRMTADGLPVSISHISKMEETVSALLPYMPRLLEDGLGRHQIEALLSLRSTLKKITQLFSGHPSEHPGTERLVGCFNETCRYIDEQNYFVLEDFIDELIGQLLRECPLSGFDYDRWLFELKVNKGKLLPQPETSSEIKYSSEIDGGQDDEDAFSPVLTEAISENKDDKLSEKPSDNSDGSKLLFSPEPVGQIVEIQDDLYGGEPVFSGDIPVGSIHTEKDISDEGGNEPGISVVSPVDIITPDPLSCAGIWPMVAGMEDIEHLQVQAYRTLFELSHELNSDSDFMASSGVNSPGFMTTAENSVLSIVMRIFTEESANTDTVSSALKQLLTGGTQADNIPVLDDAQFVLWMKLMYILRCLFSLQRAVGPDITDDDSEFE
ncbi:ParB family protein [Proteus mirabilis]|nr:ParB N-terminal domain-containing protein [Escherichia coli]EKU2367723.1 ParB N-terminal domain-containing protein [Proteus mirabilis]HBU0172485.1 ParB N-terminal domain-containing protein [Klebsiella pneumoniae]EKU7915426.1 ParB N-terminal domain-containing protein [Proteus mirabilis]EKU7921259.1 ParB N-terminal domain-containing protein [Proteus mirabilis]